MAVCLDTGNTHYVRKGSTAATSPWPPLSPPRRTRAEGRWRRALRSLGASGRGKCRDIALCRRTVSFRRRDQVANRQTSAGRSCRLLARTCSASPIRRGRAGPLRWSQRSLHVEPSSLRNGTGALRRCQLRLEFPASTIRRDLQRCQGAIGIVGGRRPGSNSVQNIWHLPFFFLVLVPVQISGALVRGQRRGVLG
jgi:hypothetical protein